MARDGGPVRMLLLFTGVFANGGIQRFNHTLLNALSALEVECDVLSIHDTPATIGTSGLEQRFRIRGFGGSRRQFSAAALGAMLRNDYDWILIGHINFLVFAISVLQLRPFARTRTALVAHGIEVWYDIRRARKTALLRVQRILCVSRYTRQRVLQQVKGICDQRIRVFPNCLGSSWRDLVPAAPQASPGARFILSVSRLERGDRYKGIVTVIETMSQLDDASLQYIVVGQGEDQAFLQQVAVRYGVEHRVSFMRGVTDSQLVQLYRSCQAFVLPSGKEGFGIVFLEAMFFGAPVIAACEKGTLDVIEDGETGLLVPFGDSIALKRAIERLTSDKALRERLRERSRSSVVGDGKFTFSRFMARTAEEFALSSRAA
jgi:phosphatidylinositol alpha-1,6-mannosyltransferase